MPRLPPRRTRMLAVVLAAICASGLLVHFDVLLAEDLYIVPFLLVGYLALELLIPPLLGGKASKDSNDKSA